MTMLYPDERTAQRQVTGAKSKPANVKAKSVAVSVAVNGNKKQADHQGQYDNTIADFFHEFNRYTGRDTLYWGYMQGHLANNPATKAGESVAVDFGCGTGWLVSHLAQKFGHVYGIDTSEPMLKIAYYNFKKDNTNFHQTAQPHMIGRANFVSAVHVHYHFDTKEKLKKMFKTVAEMLKPNGEFLLIGCPSDHTRLSPSHYTNHVHKDDVPADVLSRASQISLISDSKGFIALKELPPFKMQDGTQMKVEFEIKDRPTKPECIQLTDTFWSDEALIATAAECGLALTTRENLALGNHANAYMAMHFVKKAAGMQP